MLSNDTQLKLAFLLQSLAEGEKQLESLRESISKELDFDPQHIFEELSDDQESHSVIPEAFLNFMSGQGFETNLNDILILYSKYDKTKKGALTFQNFLDMILPSHSTALRALCSKKGQYNMAKREESVPAKKKSRLTVQVAQLVEREINIIRIAQNLKKIVVSKKDFDILKAFKVIANPSVLQGDSNSDSFEFGKKFIDVDSLVEFFEVTSVEISYEDILAIFRQMNRSLDGRISFKDFAECILPEDISRREYPVKRGGNYSSGKQYESYQTVRRNNLNESESNEPESSGNKVFRYPKGNEDSGERLRSKGLGSRGEEETDLEATKTNGVRKSTKMRSDLKNEQPEAAGLRRRSRSRQGYRTSQPEKNTSEFKFESEGNERQAPAGSSVRAKMNSGENRRESRSPLRSTLRNERREIGEDSEDRSTIVRNLESKQTLGNKPPLKGQLASTNATNSSPNIKKYENGNEDAYPTPSQFKANDFVPKKRAKPQAYMPSTVDQAERTPEKAKQEKINSSRQSPVPIASARGSTLTEKLPSSPQRRRREETSKEQRPSVLSQQPQTKTPERRRNLNSRSKDPYRGSEVLNAFQSEQPSLNQTFKSPPKDEDEPVKESYDDSKEYMIYLSKPSHRASPVTQDRMRNLSRGQGRDEPNTNDPNDDAKNNDRNMGEFLEKPANSIYISKVQNNPAEGKNPFNNRLQSNETFGKEALEETSSFLTSQSPERGEAKNKDSEQILRDEIRGDVVKVVKMIAKCETELESLRGELATASDFNVMELFLMVDKTQKGFLTQKDVSLFFDELGVGLKSVEIQMIWKRFGNIEVLRLSQWIRLFACISNGRLSDLLVDRMIEKTGARQIMDFSSKTLGLLKVFFTKFVRNELLVENQKQSFQNNLDSLMRKFSMTTEDQKRKIIESINTQEILKSLSIWEAVNKNEDGRILETLVIPKNALQFLDIVK